MKVLGVDLSTKKVSFAKVIGSSSPLRVEYSEAVVEGGHMGDRLVPLIEEMGVLLDINGGLLSDVDVAYVEDVSFARMQQTGLALARVQGAVIALLTCRGIPTHVVNNMTWKAYHKLPKKQVKQRAVGLFVEIFEMEPPNYDVTDATMIALYGLSLHK